MTPAPESLAGVALAFARACMGWENPEPSGMPFVELMELRPDGDRFFRFTDLDAVMATVRGWADRASVIPKIEVHPERMVVSIYTRDGGYLGSEYHPDLCHVLLTACVAAARKLRAG